MKIVMASTPSLGHVNPTLGLARLLLADGHEVVVTTGSTFQDRVRGIGAGFRPFLESADHDPQDPLPELKTLPPGLEWTRVAMCGMIDEIPALHEGLQQVLQDIQPDILIADDMYLGVVPMLLGPRAKRPPIALFGTFPLHWHREDGVPNFLGLHPATTREQREQYAAITREYDHIVKEPVARYLNRCLEKLGVEPLSTPLFETMVELADLYLQPTTPSFEFPRAFPPSVHFVGALPIVPNQTPLPSWADDLDGSRKVVLVSQGTMANHNFNLLVVPTLAALADEPDVLVVAVAGGRPVEAIPGPIPANARLASYLPFEWILPRADVFVTNGGYGGVNQALTFGVPLVGAGQTEDKADVNARIAWSGVGIDLATNKPTSAALRKAIRTVLDTESYRLRASLIAEEFAAMDTRNDILRLLGQIVQKAKEPEDARVERTLGEREAVNDGNVAHPM